MLLAKQEITSSQTAGRCNLFIYWGRCNSFIYWGCTVQSDPFLKSRYSPVYITDVILNSSSCLLSYLTLLFGPTLYGFSHPLWILCPIRAVLINKSLWAAASTVHTFA